MLKLLKAIEFSIDDVDQVNSLYHEWKIRGNPKDLEKIEIWAYSWIRRYYLVKYLKGIIDQIEVELLIEDAFVTFYKRHQGILDPDHFASWVSVVCKNRFLNCLSLRHPNVMQVGWDDEMQAGFTTDIAQQMDDKHLVEEIIPNELKRLPGYVQGILRKKLWEGKSFTEVGVEMNYSVETVRAYYSVGISALKSSKKLLELVGE
jgi:DNA-directed RNA polymerase specialized sigma24 family protein